MEITQKQAHDELNEIELTIERTRKKIASGSTAPCLILWGVIWFAAYVFTYVSYSFERQSFHFQLAQRVSIGIHISGLCWLVLIPIGFIATWIISVRKSPIRSTGDRRWFLCWLIWFGYLFLWIAFFGGSNEYQISAFAASSAMFMYVMTGFWFDKVLFWLGLAVTVLIAFCFFRFNCQPIFWIWMAILGGGALAGTGIYIQRAWR